MSDINYPNIIYVSGLPIAWRGCNGMYTRSGEVNGRPVYRLRSHSYLAIDIRPMKILWNGRFWLLCPDDGNDCIVARGPSYDLPFGDWGTCLVTPESSFGTWWRSNDIYAMILIAIVAFWYLK